LGEFLPDEGAETLAHPCDGHLGGAFVDLELSGGGLIARKGLISGQESLQPFEQRPTARHLELLAQSAQSAIDDRQRPGAVKRAVRGGAGARFPAKAALRQGEIEREEFDMPASLLGEFAVVFVRQEMFEGPEQERPESALSGVGSVHTSR
jgi:hypothetical protein